MSPTWASLRVCVLPSSPVLPKSDSVRSHNKNYVSRVLFLVGEGKCPPPPSPEDFNSSKFNLAHYTCTPSKCLPICFCLHLALVIASYPVPTLHRTVEYRVFQLHMLLTLASKVRILYLNALVVRTYTPIASPISLL